MDPLELLGAIYLLVAAVSLAVVLGMSRSGHAEPGDAEDDLGAAEW